MEYREQHQHSEAIAENYAVVCPDVLDLVFDDFPALSGLHPVGVDGRLDLEPIGRPHVEGFTVQQINPLLADVAGVPASRVHMRIADYHGQCVYLFGEVMGLQRAVAYQGDETVLELLQRTGGITPTAAPDEVYVVRTHAGDGKRPEVIHVNLRAIVLNHDNRTNVHVQPFDQVHVGASKQAGIQKCVPPWLRPSLQQLFGWLPLPDSNRNAETPES
jgi:protein involved in polysaccharide export with SLBB domain